MSATQDWSDLSLIGLFRIEVETQVQLLNEHLLALESTQTADNPAIKSDSLDTLMRAAHSIKGAARIVQVEPAVKVAHILEDCFMVARQGTLTLDHEAIDTLLLACDFLQRLSSLDESTLVNQVDSYAEDANTLVLSIEALVTTTLNQPDASNGALPPVESAVESAIEETAETNRIPTAPPIADHTGENGAEKSASELGSTAEYERNHRTVRMSANNLNRLMGLAGESLVESNWLQPFSGALLQLKQQQQAVISLLENIDQQATLPAETQRLNIQTAIANMQLCHQTLGQRISDLDLFSRRFGQLSDRLYREVIASHMCDFGSGTQGYQRLVRDTAKQLGKRVSIDIKGLSTQVDRDILEKLDAPITHLLTNAITHGIELPEIRQSLGKPPAGNITVEALHRSGMLVVTVSDDGAGLDFVALKQKIIQKGMTVAAVVDQMSEAELIEFLFLPGFSTREGADHLAGRGFGLDIARSMVKAVGGSLQAQSTAGKGTQFIFQLPLTLSVVRSLIVDIAHEPYALSLARIGRVIKLRPDQICHSEGLPYFSLEGSLDGSENVRLLSARQLLNMGEPGSDAILQRSGIASAPTAQPSHKPTQQTVDQRVVLIGEVGNRYGLVVDQILEERDLVVRPLDLRLGKVPHISAAALDEKGNPILILDIADLLQSAVNATETEQSHLFYTDIEQPAEHASGQSAEPGETAGRQKRILVVDDSMTVRAMEKKLLQNHGYEVDIAVNGAEGWNAVRMNPYDLVITDVDMPRMTGIELIEHMRSYEATRQLPIIIVSYKDRQADQLAGLNAGANYYLTKSSFHNDGLLNAVKDLIGP